MRCVQQTGNPNHYLACWWASHGRLLIIYLTRRCWGTRTKKKQQMNKSSYKSNMSDIGFDKIVSVSVSSGKSDTDETSKWTFFQDCVNFSFFLMISLKQWFSVLLILKGAESPMFGHVQHCSYWHLQCTTLDCRYGQVDSKRVHLNYCGEKRSGPLICFLNQTCWHLKSSCYIALPLYYTEFIVWHWGSCV